MSGLREAPLHRTTLAMAASAADGRETLPAVGDPVQVPVPSGRPGRSLALAHEPYDPYSERVRALRTELLLRRESGSGALSVVLVSPCPGEGRSQLAAELAVAFARLGRPTLLVDADMRHPRQHELFRLDNRRGLSDALRNEAPPQLRAIEGLPHLSVLTSGAVLPNSALELLAEDRFHELVEEWRSRYAFMLFDTPPIQRYSDGLAVSTKVGHVLTLTRAEHTPYREARDLLRRLAATQARVLGAVINRF